MKGRRDRPDRAEPAPLLVDDRRLDAEQARAARPLHRVGRAVHQDQPDAGSIRTLAPSRKGGCRSTPIVLPFDPGYALGTLISPHSI